MKQTTYVATDRKQFARILREYRNAECVRSYGRLGQFGRSLVTRMDMTITLPDYTSRPPMNIHPALDTNAPKGTV